jgi:hypothetical protein
MSGANGADETPSVAANTPYIVGSIDSGLMFDFANGKVSSILSGPGAA